jgi:hypothetical protein
MEVAIPQVINITLGSGLAITLQRTHTAVPELFNLYVLTVMAYSQVKE